MTQVYVKYNPYRLETLIMVNGREIETDSTLYKVVKGKRLQEWIGQFPNMLKTELNSIDFNLEFCGMDLDWDDFEDTFQQAEADKILRIGSLRFVEGKSDEDITEDIVEIFNDLKKGPIDDFRDQKLLRAFESIQTSEFPVNVIATMSSGKSTLINALLRKRLMPSKNEACTATITEILDTDDAGFSAVVFDENNRVLQEVDSLTYEVMNELNENEQVSRIEAEGDIPFLDSRSTALMLVDTPGPNNAQNQAHKNTTFKAINNDSNNLILYVLNGTQLGTNDDDSLLRYVAEQMKKGGKQVRDRFLFVINKMDGFNPEEEDIGKAVQSAKKYLSRHGIEDPQIFPCSAFTALNIRTYFANVDIDNLTRNEERKLPTAAKDTLPMIYKFIDYDNMHLEQYSTLSPSAQRELNYRLKQAQEVGDTKEQALIHCGICSVEAAITAYVKKYAKTKKVKDLVECFEEVLESNQVLVKAKTQVATDEKAAKACAERAAHVKAVIADGKEAAICKKKISELNPMGTIMAKSNNLKEDASRKASMVFKGCGDYIKSRDEAKRLVNQFVVMSSDTIAEMATELESVIHHEIVDTGEEILLEYQEKLSKIDEATTNQQLEFDTLELVKGKLNNMKENIDAWSSDNFATETIDDMGEVSYETKTYYEKVGQEEEEIIVGSHKEKIGTKKVKVGSHKVKVGTKKVDNPKRQGFWGFFKFWEPDKIDQDIYETVNDYENKDIYETVMDYKTVMRDIFEQREETIEKFSIETSSMQTDLVSKFRQNIDEGINDALEYANEQVSKMKNQFSKWLDELDKEIANKYDELEKCVSDQKLKEAELEKNRKLLNWIEACRSEITELLEM